MASADIVRRRLRRELTSMTQKRKNPTTSRVAKLSRQAQKLSESPPNSDTYPITLQWEQTGICFYCGLALESLQPGGLNPRHLIDQSPYGACRQ